MNTRTQLLEWFMPSVEVMVFVIIFWMSLLFMPQMMNGDGDLGRHITLGNHILDSGNIPTTDLFSHTMTGAFMVPHEWLSQILFALVHQAAGLNGVAWLTALLIASTYALITAVLRHIGVRAFLALLGGMLAAIVGALHTLTRPHLYTLLFFALTLFILESYRQHKKWRALLWLIPLMIIWANTHGAFIAGLVLIGIYAVGTLLNKHINIAGIYLLLLLLLIISTLLNPTGIALLENSFAYLQEDFLVDLTIEYRSPNFHTISTWPFAALLLGSLAFGWWTGRRLSLLAIGLLGVWTAFALYSARNIPLYGLVAVVVLFPELDQWIDEVWPKIGRFLSRTDLIARQSWGWMWVIGIMLILMNLQANGMKLDVFNAGNNFDPSVFPVSAIDTLEDSLPKGLMFNEFGWGGYLLYRLWPQQRVFIDAQTDFYGELLTREFLQIANAEAGWKEKLTDYNIEWIIIPPTRPLAAWLAQDVEWALLYEDETAIVWTKVD